MKVGIGDIRLHIPEPQLDMARLVQERIRNNPRMERHLQRACSTTGQLALRFPNPWEDTATMAAQAAYGLIREGAPFDLSALRHLVAGTETTVDQTKPVSAYVQGMLQRAGVGIPESLSSFQVQHACAGGTMGLIAVASMLAAGGRGGDRGLVISSDIARYEIGSTAEVTQGAGAAALLVEAEPRLLELDLGSIGYCSRDVDDFFRPNGSELAMVKGRYSMDLYIDNLREAFADHCRRRGEQPARVLESSDLIILHTPFRNMPELAMQKLLAEQLGLDNEGGRCFLEERGFFRGLDPLAWIGNTYSASLFVFLAFALEERWQALGTDIVGRKVLLASYGSGNTMVVFSATVAPRAPEIIARWDLRQVLAGARPAAIEEYRLWAKGPYGREEYNGMAAGFSVRPGAFYLSGLRGDGYREYKHAADVGDWVAQGEPPVHLRRSFQIQD